MNKTTTTIHNPSVFHLEVILAIRFHGCFLMLNVSKRCPFHHLKGHHLNAQNWCFGCLYARTPASFSLQGSLFVYEFCASLLVQELETAGTFLNHTNLPQKPAKRVGETFHHSPAEVLHHETWWRVVHHFAISTDTSYAWILGSYATSTGMTLKRRRRHAR